MVKGTGIEYPDKKRTATDIKPELLFCSSIFFREQGVA
jgi:hypothetical protein